MIKRTFFLCIGLILLSSCFGGRTNPSNFYNLVTSDDGETRIKTKENFVIGIELVSVPGYLDRPEIVTRKAGNTELDISEYNRWAEPLSTSLQRVISNNMSTYMPNSTVRPITIFRKYFDYTIVVYINGFEGRFNDKVYLNAWYFIADKNGNNLLSERIVLDIPVGNTYDDLVEKQSVLIGNLSEELAKRIGKVRR